MPSVCLQFAFSSLLNVCELQVFVQGQEKLVLTAKVDGPRQSIRPRSPPPASPTPAQSTRPRSSPPTSPPSRPTHSPTTSLPDPLPHIMGKVHWNDNRSCRPRSPLLWLSSFPPFAPCVPNTASILQKRNLLRWVEKSCTTLKRGPCHGELL